jgi:hypothetical protein
MHGGESLLIVPTYMVMAGMFCATGRYYIARQMNDAGINVHLDRDFNLR